MITFALGVAVGIVMALTGAGGGILAVPLLVFGAHISMAASAPVGLLAVGMASALGAVLGLRAGTVRYRAAIVMALTGMLAAPLGIAIAGRTDDAWLGAVFAVVLLLVAFRAWPRGTQRAGVAQPAAPRAAPCMRNERSGRFSWSWPCFRAMTATGSGAGLMSGLLGVGGGFVVVPALQRFTDLGMQSIVPTSLAVIALVSASGVVSAGVAGTLDWQLALPFAAGTMGGMAAGRMVAGRIGPHVLQRGFAAVTAMVALGMLWKSLS